MSTTPEPPRLDDLAAFMAVAEETSFTRAAARLGISQSALSRTIKALEERVGVHLLARTTRSVATTEAGERLLTRLRPAVVDIEGAIDDLRELRQKPSGTIRITTMKHASRTLLRPVLPRFLREYPDVTVEISNDEGLTDIVASRFDAGIRFGETIEKDMIAVPLSGEIRTAIVGSPAYFASRPRPRTLDDLLSHRCINYRFTTSGRVYPWEFSDAAGRPVQIQVNGPLVINDSELLLDLVLDGHGLGYLFEDAVREHLAAGTLVRVLARYCAPFPGYYLYYPRHRRTPALAAFVEAVR